LKDEAGKRIRGMREWASLFKNTRIVPARFQARRLPRSLQLPITKRCNSRCVTCNIWKGDAKSEIPVDELDGYLKDPVFRKIRSVGVNGGEPSLHSDLIAVVDVLIRRLRRLKAVNLITNGLLSPKSLAGFETLKSMCVRHGVQFNVTVSLTGIGVVHDRVRGIPGGFEKTMSTIERLKDPAGRYCHKLTVLCTISKQNVDYLGELCAYAEINQLPMNYHLAVPNARIGVFDKAEAFDVMSEAGTRQAAMEFFYIQYRRGKTPRQKFKYFASYEYLLNGGKNGSTACNWLKQDITMDDEFNLFYCAAASEQLGNVRDECGKRIVFGKAGGGHAKYLMDKKCPNCIHYAQYPNLAGLLRFLFSAVHLKYWKKNYELRRW
jgi:MoaA/NifB/PqqE/SkfB family radical SAM enzyme